MRAMRCRDGEHAERIAPVDVDVVLLAIIIQRLMDKLDDFMSIRLGAKSIRPSTSGAVVRSVTCLVEEIWKRRVGTTRNAPWLFL